MKILIVGFDGQLGMDCRKVLAQDHTLLTPSLDELDLCRAEESTSYIADQKADVVINCAAYTAVDRCEQERALATMVNADGPHAIARGCRAAGSRLIHISTDYVFDGNKPIPQPYTEDDKVNPLSEYGRTKLAGEEAVKSELQNYLILRTAWLYSANGPNFLKTMLRLSLADPKAQRKVVNDQFGSLTWSYTLARQIAKLLTGDIRGIAHASSEGSSTWYEAAVYFLQKMRVPHNLVPCSTADYPTPAHRPANSILENAVLKSKNLSIFPNWKEDVDNFVKEHRRNLLEEVS